MKVMTNKTEACGLQSRTDVKQQVAQMAAPNRKDGNEETVLHRICNPMPKSSGFVIPTFLSASIFRRATLLLMLVVMSAGSAWGQTFEGKLKTTGKTVNKYIKWDQTSAKFSISDLPTQLGTTLSDLKDAYYIKWYIENGSDEKQTMVMGGYQQANWSVAVKDNPWPYQKDNDSNITAIYLHQGINFCGSDNLETKWTDWNLCQPTIYAPSGGTFETYKDYKVICVATNGSPTLNAYNTALMESEPDFDIQYVFHFNSTGLEPDDFVGSFSGTETPLSHEVTSRTETTTTIDMSGVLSTLPSAQYARFYLTQGGEAKDISATVISVTGGQTTSKDSRGIYLYTGSALTSSDLSAVTVNLPAGTYTNYQLVAVFSDDAPRAATGTTVTQEPADLDVKYVYNFTYPVTVIDKYIKWDTNQTTLNISGFLATDLPSLNGSSTKGYIGWSVLNNSSSPVTMIADHYSNHSEWSFSNSGNQFSPYGTGATNTIFSISDSQISGNFTTFTKPQVNAPNSDLFEAYSDYTIVCNVSDESSSKIQVRYVFHFNATGKKPDTFSGKLKGSGQALTGGAVVGQPDAIAKSVENATLNFTNALAAAPGATYVRFYLKKDGEAVSRTGKLSVTGGTEGPEVEHGYYIYKSGGLTAADVDDEVSLILGAGEFEDYQVVAVFGDGEPSGTPLKEVDWDLQYTYAFEYPFKGDASSATVVEKTFSITESKKTQTLTMAYDIAKNKITLKDGSDNMIGEVNVDASTFWSAYGSALSGSQPFYVRWFLQDKSGVEATSLASAGAIVDGGSSLYAVPEKAGYGLYFSTGNGTQALNNIMTIKVKGSKVTDLAQYNLVCTIATDLTGETFDGSSLTHEPNEMVLKYVLKFEDAEWAGTIAVDAKTHSKEVLIPTASTTEIDVPLSDSFTKILSENGSRTPTGLAHDPNEFHIRWYVEKSDGSNYIAISNPEDLLSTVTVSNEGNATQRHKTKAGYGIYWSSLTNYDASNNHYNPIAGDATSNKSTDDVKKLLNIHFTKPSADEWSEYRLVAVMTKDLTGAVASPTTGERELDKEPTTLDIVYYFKFFVEDEFQFVHDKGASGRDYITAADDSRIAGTVQQYNWDNDTSTKETVSGDVRQGVHTVEYNIYVDPSSTTPVRLKLPFQNYFGTGNNLEPLAYIRWYDWTTDMGSDKLTAVGTWLENTDVKTKERGLFMLNNSLNGQSPYHDRVGVTFNPYGITGTIVIACDVSKYYDGIYQGSANDSRTDFTGLKKPYLMHEPTLSTRYIFNIRPASVIADLIKTGTDKFAVNDEHKFELAEDNGRVSVAIKDASTSFSVRTNSPQLGDYYVYDASNDLVNCSKVTWDAYLEDEGGLWKRQLALVGNGTDRISSFTVSQLSGKYELVTDNTQTKSVTAGNGMRFHLVASLGDGTTMVPTVHYEMNLQEAPAYTISSLPLERTAEYLENHMTLQSTLNFDEYLGLTPTIASQSVNHTDEPFKWNEAEYGFCYPQIDEYRVWTQADGDYSGISSIHGDYMLLKSMNATGISEKDVTHDYKYHWYVGTPTLYDYTKLHGSGEYGTFLYVDASDESRTITKLRFNANLCAGSELCFTAVIANMTDGNMKPQVMATVYAVDGSGNKTRVVSFLSSDLSTTVTGSYSDGKWNQFYGRIAIPVGVDLTGVDHYDVYVDNYALNTDGADYCLDEIKFYTSTGKMKVKQTGGLCYGDDLSLTTYMTAELLESKMSTALSSTPQPLYYRIFRQTGTSGTQILYEAYPDASVYNNGGKDYGETTVCKAVLNAEGTALDNSTTEKATQNKGYYFETDGILYFKIADNKVFNLEQGYNYFFALTNNLPFDATAPYTDTPSSAKSDWADPNDACDIFSNFFVPKKLTMDFKDGDSDVSTMISSGCSGGTPNVSGYRIVLKYPDDTEASGFRMYTNNNADDNKNIHFDFYIGKDESTTEFLAIFTAMHYFRQDYPSATTWPAFTGSETNYAKYSAILTNDVKAKIILAKSTTFSYSSLTSGVNYFLAMPVEAKTPDMKAEDICSPILFSFTVNASAGKPELSLGFDDVTYPSDYTRVVRVGLAQLNNAKESGSYTLHIPVHSFKDKNAATTNSIVFDNANLTLRAIYGVAGSNTTDPTKTTANAVIATLQDDTSAGRPIVNGTHKYLAVKFADEFTFYEGYQYELHTVYYDSADDESGAPATGACTDDLYLIIKVVPEYVTWNDDGTTVTPNGNLSNNWNNDANWSRSSKKELYKETAGQNSDNYKNNTEINSLLTPTPATYVPMKFTYVTMPTGNVAPGLINLTTGTDGLYNNIGTGAADNIQYDMLVRYGVYTTALDGTDVAGDKCKDHGISGNVYDCEKFRSNVCKEIYFKPEAELINQQYLRYEKAWVEKELTENKWYLMSAPLKETYAGDMYVPKADGQQKTEAFKAIKLTDTGNAGGTLNTGYSRTVYPIYQRSWDRTDSKVYTEAAGMRQPSYLADLGTSGVNTTLTQWSHTFNDVDVNYTALQGFSIRANRKGTGKALLRLPKDDEGYDYYNYNDSQSSTVKHTFSKTTADIGRLVTDGTTDGEVNGAVASLNTSGNEYYLIGNPYMASIDMAQFFSVNGISGDNAKYWTFADGTPSTAQSTGIIRPLESFFIKASTKPTIKFTKAMMVDGNHYSGSGNTRAAVAPALTLSASNGYGSSSASVEVREKASADYVGSEDVETLFDSNLADVPMIFTVAGRQAVSIDARPSLDIVPFGVACGNSDDPVEVSLSWNENSPSAVSEAGAESQIFLLDAVTGSVTEVGEGSTYSVQPNDYGRYFLTTRGGLTAIQEAKGGNGIVVSVRNKTLTVRSDAGLKAVRIVTVGGETVASAADCGTEASFALANSGVYIVEVQTASGGKTMKAVVR